jgi:hypothetical protein
VTTNLLAERQRGLLNHCRVFLGVFALCVLSWAGSSRREDVLDTVIGLRRPDDYRPEDGARVEVHLEKARSFASDAGRPFEARLVTTPDGSGLTWTARDVAPSQLDEAAALFRSGATVRDAAARLGIGKSATAVVAQFLSARVIAHGFAEGRTAGERIAFGSDTAMTKAAN